MSFHVMLCLTVATAASTSTGGDPYLIVRNAQDRRRDALTSPLLLPATDDCIFHDLCPAQLGPWSAAAAVPLRRQSAFRTSLVNGR